MAAIAAAGDYCLQGRIWRFFGKTAPRRLLRLGSSDRAGAVAALGSTAPRRGLTTRRPLLPFGVSIFQSDGRWRRGAADAVLNFFFSGPFIENTTQTSLLGRVKMQPAQAGLIGITADNLREKIVRATVFQMQHHIDVVIFFSGAETATTTISGLIADTKALVLPAANSNSHEA